MALGYIIAHSIVIPYEWLCRRCACNNKYIWNTSYLSIHILLVCLILRRAWVVPIGIFVATIVGARFALLVFCFILPRIWYINYPKNTPPLGILVNPAMKELFMECSLDTCTLSTIFLLNWVWEFWLSRPSMLVKSDHEGITYQFLLQLMYLWTWFTEN